MRVYNATKHTLLGDRIEVARSFLRRAVGLMGRPSLALGEGLYLPACTSVHTAFMRFPLDLIFVDRHQRITCCVRNLSPWRLSPVIFRAQGVLELPAGAIQATGSSVGDKLEHIETK